MASRHKKPNSRVTARSDANIIESLRKQFESLKESCLRYDAGNEIEILNISARLRAILDTNSPIIQQLKISKILMFRDTSTHRVDNDRNICIANIQCVIIPGVGAKWSPLYDDWPKGHARAEDQPFHKWWNDHIMPRSVEDGLDRTPIYSRRDIVRFVANQEGGAHLGQLETDFDELTRDNFTVEVAFKGSSGESPFIPSQGNPVFACIRQIGHEVLQTLDNNLQTALKARSVVFRE
jgi:hypothetical protein